MLNVKLKIRILDCRETLTSIVVILVCAGVSHAQKIDNTAFYRNVSEKSLRIHYENDFFSRSDIYYTQGINLELYHPGLKNSFLRRILVQMPNVKTSMGVAVEHLGFTPTSISSPSILYNDRPFASCLMAKFFSVSNDSIRKLQVSSTFSLGIIGPGAGGKQFQSAIHRWINDRQPRGWENQIRNDIVVNYRVDVVKGVVGWRHLQVAVKGSASAGTLTTQASGGFVVMAGWFENRWANSVRKNNFEVYVYDEPVGALVGYDATLQGGVLNRESPYTILSKDISRGVFQNNAGIIFVIRKIQLEYFQSFITKEFSTGRLHHWGGVRVGVKL